MRNNNEVTIIGGGLAGCEAAYQLAKRGVKVKLFEMKPNKKTPAHKSNNLAELVCSNSLKSKELTTASGLLKAELKLLDSLVLDCAYQTVVDAGGALAVDRDKFSELVTKKIRSYDNITIINDEVVSVPENEVCIVASGPLTSEGLSNNLQKILGSDYLYFYDACSPIVDYATIDMSRAFVADRYGKGNGDYVNCPMTREEYQNFWSELVSAKRVELKTFEDIKVFEGCMPVEVMADRGENTLRFGPLKPVGITNPDGTKPYAVVQLRKEDNYNKLYNLVGFQTNLTFGEQKRVFGLIPALKDAEYVRYGVMHRNTFVNAPTVMRNTMQTKIKDSLFVAGQLSGVEGYLESVGSGLIAGINAYNYINDKDMFVLPSTTTLGSLIKYICNAEPSKFQPIHVNFGIIDGLDHNIRDEKLRKQALANKSLEDITKLIKEIE